MVPEPTVECHCEPVILRQKFLVRQSRLTCQMCVDDKFTEGLKHWFDETSLFGQCKHSAIDREPPVKSFSSPQSCITDDN